MQAMQRSKRFLPYLYPVMFLSYLFPILKRRASDNNETLELYLYRNQYQLGTKDAMYSDGKRYRPLTVAFDFLGKTRLETIESVLVLGTGLASAAHILNAKGYSPTYTLVEYNDTILKWAIELLPDNVLLKTDPVLADAEDYMKNEHRRYDLIIIDIFKGRVVPAFATSLAFLETCRVRVNPARHVVINYIINDTEEWETANRNINHVFPVNKMLTRGVNRIYVATV